MRDPTIVSYLSFGDSDYELGCRDSGITIVSYIAYSRLGIFLGLGWQLVGHIPRRYEVGRIATITYNSFSLSW
jgi:hypothetical protein